MLLLIPNMFSPSWMPYPLCDNLISNFLGVLNSDVFNGIAIDSAPSADPPCWFGFFSSGMFHFIRSAWAGDLLVTQEQVYKCVQTVKGKKLWKCYKPTCQAKCYTKNGKVVVRMGLHSHDIPRRYLKEKAHQGKMFVKKLT